jgi:hypothetical protein
MHTRNNSYYFYSHIILIVTYFILQERLHVPLERIQLPLPEESSFVVEAMDSIPSARVTTAQTRGRGKARVVPAEGGRGRGRGRGNGKKKATKEATGSTSGRGRGRGTKRKLVHNPTTAAATTASPTAPERGNNSEDYITALGSAHYWLFGDDQVANHRLPDLNEVVNDEMSEEIQITQNAPM